MTDPTFQDRRKEPQSALAMLVQQIHDNTVVIDKKITDGLASIRTEAFPEGDADGHRRHHEAVIKSAEDRAAFWQTLRIELAKWGLVGFVAWAVVAIWQAFLQGPHK